MKEEFCECGETKGAHHMGGVEHSFRPACGQCGDPSKENVLCEECDGDVLVCKYRHIVKPCECGHCPIGATWQESDD